MLTKTLLTHLGIESSSSDGNKHKDFAYKRILAAKNINMIENIFQMMLILYESFSKDYTVSFLAMFNVGFGLIMCTITFAERVVQRFA